MKSSLFPLALAGAVLLGTPVLAQEQAPPQTSIFRDTDAAMTCRQISEEAAQLSATMGESEGGGVFGRLGGVARSGAAMLIPGAGLAMAGADALTQPGRERRQAHELAVQNRWYYLNGLYTGLRCDQQAEAATPPPAPAITPAPPSPG